MDSVDKGVLRSTTSRSHSLLRGCLQVIQASTPCRFINGCTLL